MTDLFLWFGGSLGGGGLLLAGILWLRRSDQRRLDGERVVLELGVPRSLDARMIRAWGAVLASASTAPGLFGGRSTAVIEGIGSGGVVTTRLRLPKADAPGLIRYLQAEAPGIAITTLEGTASRPLTVRSAQELRLRRGRAGLAISDQPAAARAVLSALAVTSGADLKVWQLIIGGGAPAAPGTTAAWTPATVWRRLTRGAQPVATPTFKAEDGLVQVTLRIGASAKTKRRQRRLVAGLRRAARSVSSPDSQFTPRLLPPRLVGRWVERGATPLLGASAPMQLDEFVGLVPLPHKGTLMVGVAVGTSPQLPVPAGVPRTGRVLGHATAGNSRPVAQGVRAACEHSLVAGPSGSGKSWLVLGMILGDAEAGRGGVFIAPKKSTIDLLLDRWPESAIDRTVLVDPLDFDRPVPTPLLAHDAEGIPELPGDSVLELLRHQSDTPLGPRSTDILRSSLYALARVPNATLFDLLRLWSDDAFRARVAAMSADDPVQFFAWFDDLGRAERSYILSAPANKVRPLLQRSVTRNMLAAPRATFSMRQAMAENLIVLVSLPEGQLGSAATVLMGDVLITRAFNAAQSRPAGSKPFFLTIDEAPRFVGTQTDLGDILARSREFGVGATLVTQSLGQFPAELRNIAVNSCRTKVAFGTVSDDARRLADALGPIVTPEMINDLAKFEAIGSVSLGGSASAPFTFKTIPLGPKIKGRAKAVRHASRQRWGIPRAEIEASFRRPEADAEGGTRSVGRRKLP